MADNADDNISAISKLNDPPASYTIEEVSGWSLLMSRRVLTIASTKEHPFWAALSEGSSSLSTFLFRPGHRILRTASAARTPSWSYNKMLVRALLLCYFTSRTTSGRSQHLEDRKRRQDDPYLRFDGHRSDRARSPQTPRAQVQVHHPATCHPK